MRITNLFYRHDPERKYPTMSQFDDIYTDVSNRVDSASRSAVDRLLRYRKAIIAAVAGAVAVVGNVVGVDSAIYDVAVAAAGVLGVTVFSNKQ